MDQSKLYQYVSENFATPAGLTGALILSVLIEGGLDGFVSKFIPDTLIRGPFYLLLIAVIVGAWVRNAYWLPRNRAKKIGIVLAIYCENKEGEKKYRNDLLLKAQSEIARASIENLHFIAVPNHMAQRALSFASNKELLKNWMKKIGGHFFVIGSVKERKESGKSKYYVDFQGAVIHQPVPLEISTEVQRDFRRSLPNQVSFFKDECELKGFQLAASLVSQSAKYVIGIAALVSLDIPLAYKLHLDLEQEIDQVPLADHPGDNLRLRLQGLLFKEENAEALRAINNGLLDEASEWIDKLINRNPRHPNGWLLRGVVLYRQGLLTQALDAISQAKKYSHDSFAWKYSMAFLRLKLGHYKVALNMCDQLNSVTGLSDERNVNEVLFFLEQEIAAGDNSLETYFWKGFLNYKKKGCWPIALTAFEKVIEVGGVGKNPLVERSKRYLQRLESRMELEPK